MGSRLPTTVKSMNKSIHIAIRPIFELESGIGVVEMRIEPDDRDKYVVNFSPEAVVELIDTINKALAELEAFAARVRPAS